MKNNKTHEDIIESASVTSLMRYLLSGENEKIKNPDNYGKYFVNGKWKQYIDDTEKSKQEMQKKLPGCLYYHLIRTFKFDDSLLSWLAEHENSQIVILGSGFDSRAIRFSHILDKNHTKVYEIDLKAMLDFKKQKMEENNLISNKEYYHIPCNFNDENWIKCFLKYNINREIPTLVLWEGVTYFLPEEIITSTLRELKKYFSGELQVTLDYAYRDYIEGDLNFYGAKELYDVLVEIGEPHFFGLNYEESSFFFKNLGYITKENLSAMMLESKYLRDNYGNSVGLPHVFNAMIDIIAYQE
ncbi:class I SAM-dependent methyltransferase [Salmonella enterica]|nr:class I SAM-dependent methyltransferase [Salmonella enterica]EJF6007669.1 class I SAM-dependent methyltransferase [Salmonella enterica]EJF6165035.1 class I SAM-dependent methyltransferase [Salmonella enterica]